MNEANINNSIKSPKVLLISAAGQKVGIISTYEALSQARTAGLDLVQISSGKDVPVCRIMDYGKWKYEQEKKTKKNKTQSPKSVIKELRFRPNTGENDLRYRAKQAQEFMKEGNKVKLSVVFKGREQEHMIETGRALLERFLGMIEMEFTISENAKADGRAIRLIIEEAKK